MLSRHCSCDPTKELVKQVAEQLASKSVRDTDFKDADEITGDEYIAVVQDGENRKARLYDMLSALGIRFGTTQYWNSQAGYIPPAGTIIIYTDYKSITEDGVTKDVPGIKVGTGNSYVQDLTFTDESTSAELYAHIQNAGVHVTPEDKEFWNNKLNVTDFQEVSDETLIFHRH